MTGTDADVGRCWTERGSQPIVRLMTVTVVATYRITHETAVVVILSQ